MGIMEYITMQLMITDLSSMSLYVKKKQLLH